LLDSLISPQIGKEGQDKGKRDETREFLSARIREEKGRRARKSQKKGKGFPGLSHWYGSQGQEPRKASFATYVVPSVGNSFPTLATRRRTRWVLGGPEPPPSPFLKPGLRA
jgi:hypothetical protein